MVCQSFENTLMKCKRSLSLASTEPIPSAEVSGPAAILIAGNSTANISCRATAGSAASTTWLKDKQPLAASGRLLFSANMSWLRIDPLQKEDNGEYTCRLENAVSSAEASYKMVVNCECLCCFHGAAHPALT